MGLDMYLTKKIYVGAEYTHRNVTGIVDIKIDGEPVQIDFNKISYIEERAGYWRKANQIHKWFVENIQDGNDDCGEYELSKEKAQELLNICKKIKESCKLIKGTIRNGQVCSAETNGKFVDVLEDGKLMKNSHVAAQLLPTGSGFFFGSTDYDQYYMQDIDETINILEPILASDNPGKDYFSNEYYYSSSW